MKKLHLWLALLSFAYIQKMSASEMVFLAGAGAIIGYGIFALIWEHLVLRFNPEKRLVTA